MQQLPLVILRSIFLLVAASVGVALIRSDQLPSEPIWLPWVVFICTLGAAMLLIAADLLIRPKRVETISAVYFGLVVGLTLTYVLRAGYLPLFNKPDSFWAGWVTMVLSIALCYVCISLLIQTKNDFRFIIPYVEFAKEIKGRAPYVLDTSVVIDGRIADVLETNIIDNQVVMPRFVIAELQNIADSSDRLRRSRGRRGLDILNRLRSNSDVELQIFDRDLPEFAGQPVDLRLVLLAKHLNGKIVTNDYNLNKVAKLHGVRVLNLNDLANALKPVFLPGENIDVRIVKTGEEAGQGVGYLDDGTMIVVEGGRDYVNRQVRIGVTSVLQTSAGRMVFGRFESLSKPDKPSEGKADGKANPVV